MKRIILGLLIAAMGMMFMGCPNLTGPAGETPPVTYTVSYDGNGNTGGSVPV
ncbi:MAG: hypothetical protein AB1798_18015 [Spirochaetota bacterium]